MLPPEAGIPIVRRELTAGGTARRGRGRRRARRHARRSGTRPAGSTRSGRRAPRTRGPMIGRVDGMGVTTGSPSRPTLDPARQPLPRRPPHRRHPGAAGRHGHRGLRRGGAAARAGLARRPDRGRRLPRAVQVLPRRAAHARRSRRSCATDGDGARRRLPPLGARTLAGQAEPNGRPCTSPARVRLAREAPEAPAPSTRPGSRATARRRSAATTIYRVYFHGPAYQVLERAWRRRRRWSWASSRRAAAEPRARGAADGGRAAARSSCCFQTAGIWEIGSHRTHGAADPRRPRRELPGRRRARPPVGDRAAARRRGRAGATPTSSTRPARPRRAARATARSRCPARVDAERRADPPRSAPASG